MSLLEFPAGVLSLTELTKRFSFLTEARQSLYSICMTYSNDFVTTHATIAAKGAHVYGLNPEQAVDFAWFSVNSVGDASIDDNDLDRHFDEWWSESKNA